jgi:hypothetical protein
MYHHRVMLFIICYKYVKIIYKIMKTNKIKRKMNENFILMKNLFLSFDDIKNLKNYEKRCMLDMIYSMKKK